MKDLYRAVAHMAEDANGLCAWLRNNCDRVDSQFLNDVVVHPSQSFKMQLRKQPVPAKAQAVCDELKKRLGIILFAYQIGELNRYVCIDKDKHPQEPNKWLSKYWHALGPVATTNRNDPEFMAAVGAMAVDQWARQQVVAGALSLNNWFDMKPEVETPLVQQLSAAPVKAAADQFFAEVWDTGSCCSAVQINGAANWFHVNL